jgi:uncharacterized membrane protein (UPF0182 family)
MIYTLAKPVRQFLAVMLLALPIGAFGLLVVAPVYSHHADLKERIEQERMMVGRLGRLAGDESARQALETQTKAAKSAGLFIEGESESIRLAALQSNISAIAAANGIKFRSARNLPSRDKYDLHLVGVQLQLVAPIAKLQKILLDIEQAKPTLFIDSMQITPLAYSRITDTDEPGQLDTRLDVYAVEARQKG